MSVKSCWVIMLVGALSACQHTSQPTQASIGQGWQLVWQDEFNATKIDLTKWQHEVNCHGGGNDELQCYTARSQNSYLKDGLLHIVARKEDYTGPLYNTDELTSNARAKLQRTQPFTSARLRTKGKGDWRYARIEVRAKLPAGQGTWPAIWMLPTDWEYGTWASSGEIDIMEAVNLKTLTDDKAAPVGTLESRIHGTLHYGGPAPENVYSGLPYTFTADQNPADVFHTYAIEWQENEIRWYVDDVHFATFESKQWYSTTQQDDGSFVENTGFAPFDKRFHLLINFAIGGNWPANVNDKGVDKSGFEKQMLVDYVRVFQCSVNPQTGQGCATYQPSAKQIIGKRK
ncbi:glycoside hydrolase family 16 protein [Pseudoalteromonas shioyasakiensis]|uniref:glycoside hydrolase family 16 protein n=1 Tax=Pseudoalteromonas shioyasakiensis TaxID=1190813 RepID=UPI002118DFD4|nr:glycoside hydrolase family 16 protein [Pseudoalteromonas shioyasakiensis]MCQ8879077.1 glycoside hydrolase family 16 protein [Pseudoalteromonas shioyasakiensis]